MNLYITVEITSRELEAKTFLACCAAAAGFDVVIGKEDMVRRVALLGPAGVFLDKSIHSEYPALFRRLRRLGHRIAVNDEEGLVFSPQQYSAFNLRECVARTVDLFFAWGESQRQVLSAKLPSLAPRCFAVGNPRLDLLRPVLRPFHEQEVAAIRAEFGRFVLINTRFAFANNAIGAEAFCNRLKTGLHGPEIGFLLKRFEFDQTLFQSFLQMTRALCARHPERLFIVRPHPSESLTPWEEIAAEHGNLRVVRRGNVHQWLLASDLLIHNGCATAIEALLLDVPCVSYRPEVAEGVDIDLPNAVSYNVFDLEGLSCCIRGQEDEAIRAARLQGWAALAPHISSDPGALAAPAMVEHMARLAQEPAAQDRVYAAGTRISAWIRHWNRGLKDRLRKLRGREKVSSNTKWVRYALPEYRDLVRRFAFYDPGFAGLEVSAAYQDCFRIRRAAAEPGRDSAREARTR